MTTATRKELEVAHVKAGITRWGEGERSGLERQARAKTTETLRIEHAVRLLEQADASEDEIRAVIAADEGSPPVDDADFGGLA